MKKQNQQPVEEPTKGFFVAFADEAQELKKLNLVNTGRSGVFYKKEELITTLESRLTEKVLHHEKTPVSIVEILVPPHAIISPNHVKFGEPTISPNNVKFGIKGGKEIPIIKIQTFTKAQKEIMKMAVA